jgi:hypothetical protein
MKADIIFGGLHDGEYPGAFPPKVENIILKLIGADTPVLHLFSGSSEIGDVRVDTNPESKATHTANVFDFLKFPVAEREWKWVIGDPDYCDEQSKRLGRKGQFNSGKVFADWRDERKLSSFMDSYARNIIWLDRRMPGFSRNFERKKVWLIFQGGWRNVRVLQWLSKTMMPLSDYDQLEGEK